MGLPGSLRMLFCNHEEVYFATTRRKILQPPRGCKIQGILGISRVGGAANPRMLNYSFFKYQQRSLPDINFPHGKVFPTPVTRSGKNTYLCTRNYKHENT